MRRHGITKGDDFISPLLNLYEIYRTFTHVLRIYGWEGIASIAGHAHLRKIWSHVLSLRRLAHSPEQTEQDHQAKTPWSVCSAKTLVREETSASWLDGERMGWAERRVGVNKSCIPIDIEVCICYWTAMSSGILDQLRIPQNTTLELMHLL